MRLGLREPFLRDPPAQLEPLGALEHRLDLLSRALGGIERDLHRHAFAARPVGHDQLRCSAGHARRLTDEPLRLPGDLVGLRDLREILADRAPAPLDPLPRFLERAQQLRAMQLDRVLCDRLRQLDASRFELAPLGLVEQHLDERPRVARHHGVGHDHPSAMHAQAPDRAHPRPRLGLRLGLCLRVLARFLVLVLVLVLVLARRHVRLEEHLCPDDRHHPRERQRRLSRALPRRGGRQLPAPELLPRALRQQPSRRATLRRSHHHECRTTGHADLQDHDALGAVSLLHDRERCCPVGRSRVVVHRRRDPTSPRRYGSTARPRSAVIVPTEPMVVTGPSFGSTKLVRRLRVESIAKSSVADGAGLTLFVQALATRLGL